MGTISSKITTGITLGLGTYTSPLTITTAGYIDDTRDSNDAIFGPNTQAWTVINQGRVFSSGSDGIGLLRGGYVSNASTGTIRGAQSGVRILGTAGTVTNAGTILGTGNYGVTLGAGGSVGNTGTGLIEGVIDGVFIRGAVGTVTNSGTIDGTGNYGVTLGASGSVGNNAGLIAGGIAGVIITGTAGTVANSGTILGTGTRNGSYGVFLGGGGSVVNTGTGLIDGVSDGVYIKGAAGTVTNSATIASSAGTGVYLKAGGTVVDSGTISGASGTAISFGGAGGNLLVLDPGYYLGGIIVGSTSAGATNTLELASTASVGTVSGLGIGFDTVTVDAGAQWVLNDNTIGTGVTLSNLGTLAVGASGYLTNAGIIGGSGQLIVKRTATLFNSGSIGIAVTLSGVGYLDNETGGSITATGTAAVYGTGTGVATVANSGMIVDTAGYGVYLANGGSVSNLGSAALIEGTLGVQFFAPGTVTNAGTIAGTGGYGVSSEGGSVSNASSGLIEGYAGIFFFNRGGAVTNSGTIDGTAAGNLSFGVYIQPGGTVVNASSGLIEGNASGVYVTGLAGTVSNYGTITGTNGVGVDLTAGGTVVDSGTISGATTAISFGGAGGNLLALEHGYSLSGGVSVAGTANTLQILGTAGAVTVDFDKTGAGFTNFGTVGFGAASGNNETLQITNTAGTVGTFASFTSFHDIVDLSAVAGGSIVGGGTLNGSDQLVVSNGTDTVTLQLDSENYTGIVWQASPDGSGGTDVAACFCRGTLIQTPSGEAAVENLAIGDQVVTVAGETKPVRWIGRRVVMARFADPLQALPVRVKAGALDDGVPRRDLCLSPDHALLIDGALIQAGALVNGSSIVRERNVPETFTYYHIELADHDLIRAENTPAETFVDNVDRMGFDNWGEHQALYGDTDIIVEMEYPRAKAHRQVPMATRARLAARAARIYPAATEAA